MKRQNFTALLCSAAFASAVLPAAAAPAVNTSSSSAAVTSEDSTASDTNTSDAGKYPLDPNTGFPAIVNKPFIMFNEGFTGTQVTRIVYQDTYNRSNFVYQDYLAGMYLSFLTQHMQPVNSTIRIAAYYPVYYTFNGMQQTAKQMFLYGIDIFAAPVLQASMWEYVRINFAPGLHFLYELTDSWRYINFGAGMELGIELPVSHYWTILMNGLFSVDYGNWGSNQRMQPYNMVWQYQLDMGVRCSIKGANKFSYIRPAAQK